MHLDAAYETFYLRYSPDLSIASQQRHAWDLKRWSALMGPKSIEAITTIDLQEFRRLSAKAKHSPSTTETTVRTIKQILNAAAAFGAIDKVPYPGRGRKIRRPTPQPATAAELRQLWLVGTAAARWPRNSGFRTPRHFWKAWIPFAYWTAFRLSDLTWGLTREHIQPGMIRFTASKTGLTHLVPMRTELWQALNSMKAGHTGPIFDCYRKPSRLRMHLARMCEAAEIRRLTPKHFRQSSCMAWFKADSTAGQCVHGCGIPGVLKHYLDPEEIMISAAPRVIWPFVVEAAHDEQSGTA